MEGTILDTALGLSCQGETPKLGALGRIGPATPGLGGRCLRVSTLDAFLADKGHPVARSFDLKRLLGSIGSAPRLVDSLMYPHFSGLGLLESSCP